MRIIKTLIVILVVSLIVLIAAGCTASNTATATPAVRNVTVSTGNISNNVTGTANLALAKTQDVSFTTGGTVDTVAVALYDSVKTGDVLAKLDTSAWETQIQTLNKSIVTAQRNVSNKETALMKVQRTVAVAEFALKQKEMDLQTAQSNLLAITEIKAAQDLVEKAQLELDIAKATQKVEAIANPATAGEWTKVIKSYQEFLNQAQANLRTVISGTGSGLSSVTVLQIAKAHLAIETSQNALNDAYTSINDSNAAVASAQLELADAKAAITDIQKQIEDINKNNPLITAPFDGIIITVSIKPGDTVAKGRTVFQIADPAQFQANFMVSEMDIFS
ncbi:MAG TPA: biotin/lipoyl-binding protein, partial [Dehalococcoidales bacterium]|nr:biotin/lipoyl-binding protein [Dehalococcoidales bacterium]